MQNKEHIMNTNATHNHTHYSTKMSAASRRHLLVLICSVPFLMGLAVDLYVPSLPVIVDYFHVRSGCVRLTIGVYLLGFGVGQLVLGILSDAWGRRSVVLWSAAFFTAASLAAALAPNIYLLLLCRLLQGLSIGGIAAATRAVIADSFLDLALIKTIGVYVMSWSLGPIIGPFIGGYLQHYFNWQADFYFFAIYGLFVFIFAAKNMPETHLHLVPLQLKKFYEGVKTFLTMPLFLGYSIIGCLFYTVLVFFNILGPFLLQVVLKCSVVTYGYIALLMGFAYFAGNFCNRILINYMQPIRVVYIAMGSALAVALMFVGVGLYLPLNIILVVIPAGILFFLTGFIIPNLSGLIAGTFGKMAGTASALTGSIGAVGAFITSALAATLKTDTQMPLAYSYAIIIFVCLILLLISQYYIRAHAVAAAAGAAVSAKPRAS
jgi:MFS transporter, DHA1 family, multidrug resistance protein